MRAGLAALLLAAATGCASAAPSEPAGACDASKAQYLVGQAASSQLAADAQRLSGAKAVRWLRPGQIVTMEYRAERLNIALDAQHRVEAIRCG